MNGVVIIGAGAIGSALTKLIKETNTTTYQWDVDSSKVKNQKPLEYIVPRATLILLCIPSFAHPDALQNLKPYLTKKHIVITVAKGFEPTSKLLVSQILRKYISKNVKDFGVLHGPMLAAELMAGRGGAAVVGIKSSAAYKIIADSFNQKRFKLYHHSDPDSVALSGVLKNIYALILGIAHGLGWQHNEYGWLTSQATQEMLYIMQKARCVPEVILGPAGIADLIATGASESSRNRTVGLQLACSQKKVSSSEGLRSVGILLTKYTSIKLSQVPLLEALQKTTSGTPAREAFNFFLTRKQ